LIAISLSCVSHPAIQIFRTEQCRSSSFAVEMSLKTDNTYCNTVNRKLNVKNRQTTVNLWGLGTWDLN
jgi:hypothetical protein